MSKRKAKAPILAIAIYILLNGLVWGCMKVYTKSYNTMNKEQITMLNIQFNEGTGAEISILNNKLSIDFSGLKDNDTIYFVTYVSSPEKLKAIVRAISEVNNHAPLNFNPLLSS